VTAVATRSAQLARARASAGLNEQDCRIWFGVSLSTIERVEAGELVPGDVLERKIDLFIQNQGSAR
jgi:ribosome-binding protein aMBF1 (putative translation factor)